MSIYFLILRNLALKGKIFEMILGLPLTYPINMLNVQRDRVSEKIGQIKLVDKSKIDTTRSTKERLEEISGSAERT